MRSLCRQLWEPGLAKAGKIRSLFSGTKVYRNVLGFLDKKSLQFAALFMVDRASKRAISEDNASDNAEDNWEALSRKADTDVPNVFLMESKSFQWIRFALYCCMNCGMNMV